MDLAPSADVISRPLRGERRGTDMRGRFLTRTSSTIVLALAGALLTGTLASAAAPPPNLNVTAMPGNEAEDAIAVNPTSPSNAVAMSTLPDVVAGLAVGVSFNSGRTWSRSVIGATTSDPLGDIRCDQQLAWDHFGNLWMTYLVNSSLDVFVAVSTDGGGSFRVAGDIPTNGDQPSISAGANSVWVSWTRTPGNQIVASGARVTGLGQYGSFSAPESVPSPGSNGDYGDTAVGPNGQVMVTYQNSTNGQGGADIYTAVDPDGLGPGRFGPTHARHPQPRRRVRLHRGQAEPLHRRRGEPRVGPDERARLPHLGGREPERERQHGRHVPALRR